MSDGLAVWMACVCSFYRIFCGQIHSRYTMIINHVFCFYHCRLHWSIKLKWPCIYFWCLKGLPYSGVFFILIFPEFEHVKIFICLSLWFCALTFLSTSFQIYVQYPVRSFILSHYRSNTGAVKWLEKIFALFTWPFCSMQLVIVYGIYYADAPFTWWSCCMPLDLLDEFWIWSFTGMIYISRKKYGLFVKCCGALLVYDIYKKNSGSFHILFLLVGVGGLGHGSCTNVNTAGARDV